MIFTSIPFWSLFILFLCVFAFIRRRSRTGMMLYVSAFSLLFFYLANDWLMLILPSLALFSWAATRWMAKQEGSKRKWAITAIVLADLVPLAYFKYTNFAIDIWNQMVGTNFSFLSIALPIGISFFTFQAISHAVDVYKGKWTEDVTFLEYLFYLSFFPLLMAGPITRAGTLFPQVKKLEPIEEKTIFTGLWLIMLGLLKKLVVADYIAQYNNWIFDDPTGYSGYENLMGMFGYTVQIYCDFSGYSDISIGLAAMMGITLLDNFNFPYQSLNVTEFWRRWHISLSTWFRDYLYIPLGGNRKGKWRTYLNNFITMLVAGLWHGSTPMFIIWGGLHGIGLMIHKFCKPFLDTIANSIFVKVFSWLLTFAFVNITWVYFRAESVDAAHTLFLQILTDFDLAYVVPFFVARPTWCILVCGAMLVHAVRSEQLHKAMDWFVASHWLVKLLLFTIVIQLCIQFHTNTVQPFIYYQF